MKQAISDISILLIVLLCFICSNMTVFAQQVEKPKPLVLLDSPMPRITGTPSDWLNTGGKPLIYETNRVYVIHFWTYGCINCKRNLSAYTNWQEKYGSRRLTVIGIHTPETEKEKAPENVAEETKKLGITYPVVIDGQTINWAQWQQQIWPTVYLIDKRGHVRAYWMGELEWQGAGGTVIMEGLIEQLLQEPDLGPPAQTMPVPQQNPKSSGPTTPGKSTDVQQP
jgi:thiol-disulfide isomerase/thioredoxin